MYFDLFYPPSLSCIRKIVHHYDLVQQLFGVEEQKVNVTLSDRGSLIALLQNKHPVYWHRLQLKRVSSQDSEKYYHVYTKEGKRNQAPLALALTFSHSWKASHGTLKNSWHKFLVYVEFAAS